jgi:hypothetical protein
MPLHANHLGDSPITDRRAAREARAEAFNILVAWAQHQGVRGRAALGAALEAAAADTPNRPARDVMLTASAMLRATVDPEPQGRP